MGKLNRFGAASAVAGAIIVSISGAEALVIDFNSHPPDFASQIFDSGFEFDVTAAGWGVFDAAEGCCDVNDNGTRSLFADGDLNGVATVVMSPVGGGTFSLSQIAAAVYFTSAPPDTLILTGQLSGGGTVTQTLDTSTTWTTYVLSGFTNLTSLTFQDGTSGDFLVAPGFGIDNINLGSPVPESSSWAMLLTGFAAFGLAGYRISRKTAAVGA